MYRQLVNNRKALIALTVAIAFVAVVVPTCRMVGCSMDMGGSAGMMHHMGSVPMMSSTCGGEYSTTDGSPLGVVPVGVEALILALFATLLGVRALFATVMQSRSLVVAYATPPPPLESPLGTRLRL